MKTADFGLGFDPLTKDYKHVRLVLNAAGGLQSVELYSVGSNLWTSVEFRADGSSSRWLQRFIFDNDQHKKLCLSGHMLGLAAIGDSELLELVSFDLSSGIFASTNLPKEDDDPDLDQKLSKADDGSSLALIKFSDKGAGSMWVLQGIGAGVKSWSWSKRYTFASMIPGYDDLAGKSSVFHLRMNAEMLFMWSRNRMVTSYNLETHKEKILVRTGLQSNVRAFPYMESLLLLK